jgi:RNA polymerase sigma-70 factor (ECF subfamily)
MPMGDYFQPLLGPALETGPAGDGSGWRSGSPGASDDDVLLAALRRGDEAAFCRLVERHQASMVRVARMHVASEAAAEEVAQEAWLGVLYGLARFEGRCSLKGWIFSIVVNCARSRGARDKRTVPMSSLGAEDEGGPSVHPDRFLDDGHPRWPGHWSQPPAAWGEDDLVSRETLEAIGAAMATLPPKQRVVMTMRDVEGLGSEETCQVLGLSEANQRVLLHRARSKVRKALESYMQEGEASP